MKTILIAWFPCLVLLSACSGATVSATPVPPATAVSSPTVISVAPPTVPSATPVPIVPPTRDPNLIGYYYFVPANSAMPEGSVVIFADTYVLAPTQLETPLSPDTAADVKAALYAALKDPRNMWISDKLDIASVAFQDGRADIFLQGEFFGVGDVTLIAARMQILLTIFANPAVQSATVTYNGDTIGNWGVSISLNAKPADYAFTRVEIESFIAENLYQSSTPPADGQPSALVFSHISGDAGNFYLLAGETITITWENAPAGADKYEFLLAPLNHETSIVLGSDLEDSDGVAISWAIPEHVAAELRAIAYFSDGHKSELSFVPIVYSGDVPPVGVCSLMAKHQPIEVYRLPDRTAEIFALLHPAVYAQVLEITSDGWYRIDASAAELYTPSQGNLPNAGFRDVAVSVVINPNLSLASGDGWVNGDKGILLAGTCPSTQP